MDTQWLDTLNRVRQIRDTLGRPVDKDIEETVAILQMMGIATTMSCGGHIDRDTGGPYVTFAHKDILQYRQIIETVGNPRSDEHKAAMHEAKKLTFHAREKMWSALEQFYKKRTVAYSHQLIIQVRPFSNTLSCQGAANVFFMNAQDREAALRANRAEMTAFTDYLKKDVLAI